MMLNVPAVLKGRQLDDAELLEMLRSADASNDVADFFRHFDYHREPQYTLAYPVPPQEHIARPCFG
jgi:hypothetical protein